MSDQSIAYTVFDAETGHILRSGQCQPGDLHRQSTARSEIVIEGALADDQYRVEIAGEDGMTAVPWQPPVTAQMVRDEARRRIESAYPLWQQINVNREGGAAAAAMNQFIDAVRAASNAIGADEPIDAGFAGDDRWPTKRKSDGR